jgi:hypothetical protein
MATLVYDEILITCACKNAWKNNLKVDLPRVERLKITLKGKKTDELVSFLEKNKKEYIVNYDSKKLENIMAVEFILSERRKDC